MVIMKLCVVDSVETNCKILSEERGLEEICLAMGRHNTDVGLVEGHVLPCGYSITIIMEGNIH